MCGACAWAPQDPSKAARAAEMAAYTASLQLRHVALRASARRLLAAGPAALAAGGVGAVGEGPARLARLEALLRTLLAHWQVRGVCSSARLENDSATPTAC